MKGEGGPPHQRMPFAEGRREEEKKKGKNGGLTRKRISPPLPKIQLCASPHWGPALPSRHTKCKVQQPNSRTACVITVSTQPGMLSWEREDGGMVATWGKNPAGGRRQVRVGGWEAKSTHGTCATHAVSSPPRGKGGGARTTYADHKGLILMAGIKISQG